MSYKSRSNYIFGQNVSYEAWDKMFPKESKDNKKESEICDNCKSTFSSDYYSNGIQYCLNCRD